MWTFHLVHYLGQTSNIGGDQFLKSSTNTFSYACCQSGQVLRYCQWYMIGYHIAIGYPIPDFEKGNCYLIECLLPEIFNDTCLSYDIAFEITIIGFENYWFEVSIQFSIDWPKLFKIYQATFILQLLKVTRCQNL